MLPHKLSNLNSQAGSAHHTEALIKTHASLLLRCTYLIHQLLLYSRDEGAHAVRPQDHRARNEQESHHQGDDGTYPPANPPTPAFVHSSWGREGMPLAGLIKRPRDLARDSSHDHVITKMAALLRRYASQAAPFLRSCLLIRSIQRRVS